MKQLWKLCFCVAAIVYVETSVKAVSAQYSYCILEVEGKRFIEGPCNVSDIQQSQSIRLDVVGIQHGYRVIIDHSYTKGYGHWSETPQTATARGYLGEMVLDGACWKNKIAALCIWPPGSRRPEQIGALTEEESLDLPIYDVDERCARRTSDTAIKWCLREEQSNYNIIKMLWSSASDESKRFCLRIMQSVKEMPYTNLASCILPKIEQDQLNNQGRFRR